MNAYITVGSLTDLSIEHIVRHCPILEQLSLNLMSFTAALDSLIELFNTPSRALKLHTISLSSFRNVRGIDLREGRILICSFSRPTNEFYGPWYTIV